MYIKVGQGYADGELQLLTELLSALDEKIIEVRKLISTSIDPESDGLTDRGEYFIGAGFSIIQQYLTDTLTLTGVSKINALDIGPRYSDELTFISVVNAAANWWKHSAEWVGQDKNERDSRTQKIIYHATDSLEYPLSNVLSKLLGTSEITLSALIPNLMLWRSSLG